MTCMLSRRVASLLVCFIALAAARPALAQQSEPVVSNVQVTVRGNYVDITYDLEQAEGLSCVVQPNLSKDGGQSFSFPVTSVTGDFGKGVTPGTGKKIVWNALKDYPDEHIPEAGLRVNAFLEEETILLPGGVPLVMVWIPDGTFLMGRYPGEQDSEANEDPRHLVTVPEFWMAKYEVTKRQWKAVMGTEPWAGQANVLNDLDSPAVWVSWNNAKAFITALNNHTGLAFRLPSEAEWEYACRAGTTTRFYWGDDPTYTVGNTYAWWRFNAYDMGNFYAHVVGRKLPNAFGLYDMSGNVWELCEDDWHENYNGAPVDGSAWVDSPRSSNRVGRNGSWGSAPGTIPVSARDSRSADRHIYWPEYTYSNHGFRLAK